MSLELKWEHFNIPNTLSVSRIVLLPLLYILTLMEMRLLMMISYIVIASTDYLDGKFARRFNQSSELGKTLDSVADLLFYLSTAFFLYWLFPGVVLGIQYLLWTMIALLAISFIYSWIRIGKPTLMHTSLLRLNAVLVMTIFTLCFMIPEWIAIWMARVVLVIYIFAFAEEMAIWTMFGSVDRDTRSILHLIRARKGDGHRP